MKWERRTRVAEIPANIFEALPDRNAWRDRNGWRVFPSPGDCPVFGCQLSAGHPPPHCLAAGGGRYQMVDEHGTILREL